MGDMITVEYPCGCEVDFETVEDTTSSCPICNSYLDPDDEPNHDDYHERMNERRQMGLCDY